MTKIRKFRFESIGLTMTERVECDRENDYVPVFECVKAGIAFDGIIRVEAVLDQSWMRADWRSYDNDWLSQDDDNWHNVSAKIEFNRDDHDYAGTITVIQRKSRLVILVGDVDRIVAAEYECGVIRND